MTGVLAAVTVRAQIIANWANDIETGLNVSRNDDVLMTLAGVLVVEWALTVGVIGDLQNIDLGKTGIGTFDADPSGQSFAVDQGNLVYFSIRKRGAGATIEVTFTIKDNQGYTIDTFTLSVVA